MTTTEFFEYLCKGERTLDLGAELRAVFELRQRMHPAGTGAAANRVPIAAA